MAKLLAPYSLCPLIEQRRFLGVSEDSSSDCVIVTLGKNIIIRYRLSDQKQVSSWSSKWKLSAPVAYDHGSKRYVGVFHLDDIAFWTGNLAQLNKIRKFKFTTNIHSILSSKDCPPVIVFYNGYVGYLNDEFQNRKATHDGLLASKETLKTSRLVCLSGDYYVSLQSASEDGKRKLYFVPVDPDRGSKFIIPLSKENVNLSAFAVIEGDSPQLLSLWSDGTLLSEELPPPGETGKSRTVAKVSCINTEQPAAILPIGEQHIILYGAAPNAEGAHLVILSLKFGLPEATQRMKVYDEKCRMWCCRNDIIVVCGGYLVVTPYRLGTTKLVALLGVGVRHQNSSDERSNNKMAHDDQNVEITDKLDALKTEGRTDHMICDELVEQLIKNKDATNILKLVDNVVDIPDRWLVEMILFALEEDKQELLGKLLTIPLVGDEGSLDLVRRRLKLQTVLQLLKVISEKLSDSAGSKCLLDWASLLLDSHYQQYLLSKADDVVETIKSIHNSIQEHLEAIQAANELKAELIALRRGRVPTKKLSVASQSYIYEKVRLY